MGAAFAIQVKTGREAQVRRLVEWALSENENAQKWVKAVHAFTQGTRRLLGKKKMGKRIEKPVVPGYIFIEMNYRVDDLNRTAYLPADVWHAIRRVPGVVRLFASAGQIIGAETFEELLKRLDTEERVEATVPVPDREKAVREVVKEFNEARTTAEKKAAHRRLKTVDADTATVTEQLEEMKKKLESIVNRIKTFLREKKETVRIPLSLFTRALRTLRVPRREAVAPETAVSLVLRTLRGDAERRVRSKKERRRWRP